MHYYYYFINVHVGAVHYYSVGVCRTPHWSSGSQLCALGQELSPSRQVFLDKGAQILTTTQGKCCVATVLVAQSVNIWQPVNETKQSPIFPRIVYFPFKIMVKFWNFEMIDCVKKSDFFCVSRCTMTLAQPLPDVIAYLCLWPCSFYFWMPSLHYQDLHVFCIYNNYKKRKQWFVDGSWQICILIVFLSAFLSEMVSPCHWVVNNSIVFRKHFAW